MHLTYLTLEAPREGQASYTHVHEIINGLKKRGWNIRLYEPSYTTAQNSPGLFARLAQSLIVQTRLWADWRRGDILYVRNHYLAFPSTLIAHAFHIPVIHEINGPYEDVFVTYPSLEKVRPILTWMQRMQYRSATALIAVTEELRQWASRESGGNPAILIPNGVNIDLFKPDLPRPGGLPDRYVIFFGGLAAWHGVQVIIDALNHADWPDGVALVVLGDGQYGDVVRDAAGLNPRLHALGKKPYREVPAYVSSALAGLIPILNQGNRAETGLFPLKLFETLACGIPAIVTDFPGQADLVRAHDCGFVIPADDAGALARAVKTLALDSVGSTSMGMRACHAMENHSWDRRAQATHDVLLRFTSIK